MADPDRIVRLKTVLARTGLSRSTLYRKIGEGSAARPRGSWLPFCDTSARIPT